MYRAQKTFKLKNPGVIREDIQNSNRIHEKSNGQKNKKKLLKIKNMIIKIQ